jgi:hypothetical protein
MNGLFCSNFATSRHPWKACRAVWCGSCYTSHPDDRFYVHVPTDEDGDHWGPDEDHLRYQLARNGDHLITPFQCDLCVFHNLQSRNPLPDNPQDTMLLCCIRRANLDSLWGREPPTVQATLSAAQNLLRTWRKVGLQPDLPSRGPYPLGDSFGYRVAIGMLLKSLEPGRYSKAYQQFETVRKLRAGFSNMYLSSAEGTSSLRTMGGDRIKHSLTRSPTQSTWFERFSQGCLRRMGQDVRQDWAITLPSMLELQALLDQEWKEPQSPEHQELVASLGAFSAIAFCASFRGCEAFMVDLRGLIKHQQDLLRMAKHDHVVIPLLGRFKGEMNSRYHLIPLASSTQSGLQVKLWVERLIEVRRQAGRVSGPAFCDKSGQPIQSTVYQEAFAERLHFIQGQKPGIIPLDVDVLESFGVSRSFRRGSTSTARTRGLDDKYVELINRWRKFENARGKRPTLPMKEHYSDIAILIPELIKYSQSL